MEHGRQTRSLSLDSPDDSPVSPLTYEVLPEDPDLIATSPYSFSPSDSLTDYEFDEHSEQSLADCMCPPGRMNWDAVVDLPLYLKVWAAKGLTACEIGQSLHRYMYGQDATLSNLVTTMVDAGKPYFEIGNAVLRNLHLRTEDGLPLWEEIADGDRSLTAMPELWRLSPDQLAAFADSTAGFSVENTAADSSGLRLLICPQPKRVQIVEPAVLIRSRQASICEASGGE
ncbi:uncharacterized protein KD926_005307 [Aspergillus affinis]|uniref:uncharacterized protein n=1 Tax=Aspergillus affinis TaxID=1070780 RepID=UPI0022FE4F88|nr:uncharacterized protein KD926_005307 [Aspergillus affinis]KAI9042701.1 hypothetical protein KD926_005307 [Aspergillus affinis]